MLPFPAILGLLLVPGAAETRSVSFQREVIPVLTKAGCNQGACHGTPTGKNGFRLSLRGYDTELDGHTLTREAAGRRLDRLNPDASLLLTKATAASPHEGGKRITPASELYTVLRNWIALGAPIDTASAPVKLDVSPASVILDSPKSSQAIRVQATFPDGVTTDVTHLTRFEVNDQIAASVGLDGIVHRKTKGEIVVVAEYMGQMATARVVFRDHDPKYRWTAPPANNFIDTAIQQKWQELQLTPAALCTDAEFVRRAHLDAIGRLPSPERVREFLNDTDPKKRERLIDELLARDEFADWWGMKWTDRLGVNQRFVGKIGAVKYHRWIREQIAANVPEDEFVRGILTAAGPNYANPAAGFFRRLRDPATRAEEIAQLFLGVRMQCAKCHNHPGERWTQNDYYRFAAFFNRLQFRDGPYFVHVYDKEETLIPIRTGDVTHPRTGAMMAPTFLGGTEAAIIAPHNPRDVFAEWLTSAENPFFARASANRIWFHLFGRGLVEPVDDFRSTNPAVSEDVLTKLAEEFAKHKFDRKHLIRVILNSRVYQLSSKPAEPTDDGKYFTHYPVRRLVAEQLLDAVCDATGVPEKFPGFPLGTPASAVPDGEFKHPWLEAFGRPARAMACECERGSDTTLSQALYLQGGEILSGKITHAEGRLAKWIASTNRDEELIETMFLATVSRLPTPAERKLILDRFATKGPDQRRTVAEDVFYALLNHREFLFQH